MPSLLLYALDNTKCNDTLYLQLRSAIITVPWSIIFTGTYQNSSIQADVVDGDGNPFPDVDGFGSRESHGTNCAGEIAMAKSNSHCGVGVAYNSRITGNSPLAVIVLLPSQEMLMH